MGLQEDRSGSTRRGGRAAWVAALAVAVLALGIGGPATAGPAPDGGERTTRALTFPDVSTTNPFWEDIEWAHDEGLVEGYVDGRFRPRAPVTRQAFAAMLYRWLDDTGPEPLATDPPEPRFTDVPVHHPFFAPIEAMAAAGLIEGYDDDTFRPTEPITRQAAAALMVRAAALIDQPTPDGPTTALGTGAAAVRSHEPPLEGTTALPDVARDHPFLVEIHVAFGLGLVTGYDDGTFQPSLVVSRQVAVALVHRLDGWVHPGYEPVWTPGACAVPTPAGRTTECGTLTVPEDRTDPSGATVELAVAIVHTNSLHPAPDPAVYLGGGPGGTVMDGLPGRYKAVLGEDRDVVLFDQRGVGLSEPNLDCPERDEALWATYATAEPFADELEGLIEATEACRERLVGAGVDLAAYNTIESARDVRDLRRALGYASWNVYGVSYGTSLAQQVVRTDPFATRTVIYDSVLPNLDLGSERLVEAADRVFDHLWAGCAADTSCAAAHPDLGAEFAEVVADYDSDPLPITIPDPGGGPERSLLLTGADLTGGLFAALYRTDVIPLLPTVVTAASTRDEATLELIASQGLAQLTELVDGVFLSVECHDRPGAGGRAAVEQLLLDRPELGSMFFTASFAYCEVWDVPGAPPTFQTLPVSPVPSLVLAGSYDPVTPPIGGQALDRALLDSTYMEFPRYGHGILTASNTCAVTVTRALLADPLAPPDTSCLASELPPDFI